MSGELWPAKNLWPACTAKGMGMSWERHGWRERGAVTAALHSDRWNQTDRKDHR